MKQLLWVGIGGFLGSIARYKLGGFVLHRSEPWDFPLSTFVVNLLGCFALGLLAALVEHHDFFPPPRDCSCSPASWEDLRRFPHLHTREHSFFVAVCRTLRCFTRR